MSELPENEIATNVRTDDPDDRDRVYPPRRLTSDDVYRRPRELFLDEIFALDVDPLPERVGYEEYKSLAEPTWHQRGQECTGFALGAIADYHLRKNISAEGWAEMSTDHRRARTTSRRMLYEMAQLYDGRDFEQGSTLRGALKGWKKLGVASDPTWPYDPDDEHGEKHGQITLERVIDAVARPGGFYFRIGRDNVENMKDALARGCPLYVSARIHVGWFRLFLPDTDGLIRQREDDAVKGGHAFVIVGYDEHGFWIHNSWGEEWALDGYARISYEDWAEHGQEVWLVIPPPAPDRTSATNPAPPPPVDASGSYRDMWRHLVTLADDGRLASSGRFGLDAAAVGTLLYLFQEQTAEWSTRRLAVFADGGYWATENTVEQLRPLRDRLMEQEIYPIFLLWEYPWFAETRSWLLGEHGLAGVDNLDRAELDEFWERHGGPTMAKVLASESVAPRVWDELVYRAEAACRPPDGGAQILSKSIAYKWGQKPFDIHLVGHGVGDLLLSEFVSLLSMPIASCQLWAPATTMDRFQATYAPLLDDGRLGHLSVSTLDEESERADRVGPVPGSALMLISDVLALADVDLDRVIASPADATASPEWNVDPEPVLGMDRFLSTDETVRRLLEARVMDVRHVSGVTHTRLVASPTVHQAAIESMIAHPARPPAPTSAPRVAPGPDPLRAAMVTDPLARAIAETRP